MIKIFVGTSEGTDDLPAEKTLEYSLHKHSSEPLDITFMRNTEDGFMGKFDSSKWPTPFTCLRWCVPEACGFEGRAIYMDVDQLNLRDISILANIDMEGKPFASRSERLCVMVFDNAAMEELLPPVATIKENPIFHKTMRPIMAQKSYHFDNRWNCLDGEGRPIEDIWHLHFTRIATQPWKPAWAWTRRKKRFEPHKRQDLVQLWESYRDEAEL